MKTNTVSCTILFTSGTLKGLEIQQNLPESLAKVGKVVKKNSWTGPGYTVVAVG